MPRWGDGSSRGRDAAGWAGAGTASAGIAAATHNIDRKDRKGLAWARSQWNAADAGAKAGRGPNGRIVPGGGKAVRQAPGLKHFARQFEVQHGERIKALKPVKRKGYAAAAATVPLYAFARQVKRDFAKPKPAPTTRQRAQSALTADAAQGSAYRQRSAVGHVGAPKQRTPLKDVKAGVPEKIDRSGWKADDRVPGLIDSGWKPSDAERKAAQQRHMQGRGSS